VLPTIEGGGSEFAAMSDEKKTTQETSIGSVAKHKAWRKRLLIAVGVVAALGAGWVFWSIIPVPHDNTRQELRDIEIWIGYHSGSWLGDHSRSLTVAFVAVLLAVAIFAIWKVPHWQVARSQGLSPENRFNRENEARTTLAQIIGGMFLLAGLYSSIQTFDLQREGQITDRYTKAIEQLGAVLPSTAQGSDGVPAPNLTVRRPPLAGRPATARSVGVPAPNLTVRLGGIYALERITHDSPKDRATIMEVLSAYVRENAPVTSPPANGNAGRLYPDPCSADASHSDPDKRPRADIQAILTVIGRQSYRIGYDLEPFDLSKTDLDGADLKNAVLSEANLRGVYFGVAHLENAGLVRADLSRADFTGACLTGADFGGADMRGATGLTQEQLDSTFGDAKTQLPDGLKRPSSWH
jgi:hypothetical protein